MTAAGGPDEPILQLTRPPCRAILFDMDDTLVPTSAIDEKALSVAARFAWSRLGRSGGDEEAEAAAMAALAARFKALLRAEPFPPPGSSATVALWRTGLWARALEGATAPDQPPSADPTPKVLADSAQQGQDEVLAAEVHDHWLSERLSLFKFPADVAQLIERLRPSYRLGIITNGPGELQRAKLEACGAAALFGPSDFCAVVSGEQPAAKPDPSIFRTALKMMGVDPGETIMVGDSLVHDIQGGIRAGLLATVWVRGASAGGGTAGLSQAPSGDGGKPVQPSYTIASVVELESVLRSLATGRGSALPDQADEA